MPIHKNVIRRTKVELKFSGDAYVGQNKLFYENIRIDTFGPDLYSGVSLSTNVILGTNITSYDSSSPIQVNISLGTGLVTAENRRNNFLTNEATLTGVGSRLGTWSDGGTEIINGVTFYVATWIQIIGSTLLIPHPTINNNKPGFLLVFTETERNINNSPGNNTNVIERATSSTYAGFLSLYILDDNIILDPFDEDTRFFNNQLIYGPSISGSTDTYFNDTSWIGKVLYKTDESDSISGVRTWKVTVGIFSEADYQRLLLAADAQNSSNSLNNAAIIQEISYSPNERADTELHALDGIIIDTANEGYTVEGYCTEEDISGDVFAGTEEVTQTGVEVNFSSTTATDNNRSFSLNFTETVVNGLKNMAFNISSSRGAGSPAIVGPFSGRMFVQVNSAQSTNDKVIDWAKALNDDSRSLLGATIVGARKIELFFKDNSTNISANPTILLNQLSATINSTQPTSSSFVDITLPLALDSNRVGTRTGITLINDDYESKTTGYNIPNLTFARGSSLTLGNGFKLDIGKGYDFTGDGKDVTITIEGNAKLAVSGQAKENMWGAKQKRLTTGSFTATVDAVLATPDNPFNVIQRTGGSLVMNLDTSLDAPVVGNRTFLYGNSTAQVNGRVIWTVDNGSTGFYNSPSFAFVYTMQGAKSGQTFDINSPTGTTIYVPIVLIKQFTGDTINLGSNNSSFQFSASYAGTNATDTLAYEYSSIWVAYGFKLLGETPDTLAAYNPTVNYLIVDVEDNNGIYSGGWNFSNRPTISKGIAVLGRLWNPSWNYSNTALTGIEESYYYGTGVQETTLVAVKEGCESAAIGTAGTNNHPFNSAVTINNTNGLANASIDGDGINRYKSYNTANITFPAFSLDSVTYAVDDIVSSVGINYRCITAYTTSSSSSAPASDTTNWEVDESWGDTNSDRDGLVLTYTKGTPPPASTTETNINLTATPHDTDWFCYSRRNGFRPRVITNEFSGSLTSYQSNTLMEPFLDRYWQATTISAIDAYVTTLATTLWSVSPSYLSGSTLLAINIPEAGDWNDVYRHIEYSENLNLITNANLSSETRAFSTINGRFRRFINTTEPVTIAGAINFTDYSLKMSMDGIVNRSTDSEAIVGIDLGTTNSFEFVSVGTGTNVIEGDFTAKDFTFTETFNTLSADNSVFNNTDAQNYTIALTNTTVNSTGAPTFSDTTTNVRVNTAGVTTISSATTDMEVLGGGSVTVSASSTDGKYGISSDKISSITYGTSVTSIGDEAFSSGDITLPASISTGVFTSDTEVIGTAVGADITAPKLTISGEYSGNGGATASSSATIGTLSGKLDLAEGVNATITDVESGAEISGFGTVSNNPSTFTTANQVTGGALKDVTWLSVPTTAIGKNHTIFAGDNVFLEFTNSGSVAFSDSFGTIDIFKGPPNTFVTNDYNNSSDYFSITSTRADTSSAFIEQSYKIRDAGTNIVGVGDIADLSDTTTSAARYHSETSGSTTKLYRLGTAQSGTTLSDDELTQVEFYSLKIETKADDVTISLGGLKSSTGDILSTDTGINYTDNIRLLEQPFVLTINFPEDYGYAAVKLPDSDGTIQDTVVSSSYVASTETDPNYFSIKTISSSDTEVDDVVTYDIVSELGTNVSNGDIVDLRGTVNSNLDSRYHLDDGLIYRIGAPQTGDQTENTSGTLTTTVDFYLLIEELNKITLSQVLLTKDDVLKVSMVKVGLAPFYEEFTITGEDQIININPEIQDYSKTAIIPDGTEINDAIALREVGLTLSGTQVTGDVHTATLGGTGFSATAVGLLTKKITVDLTFVDDTAGTVTLTLGDVDYSTTTTSSKLNTITAIQTEIGSDYSTSLDTEILTITGVESDGDFSVEFDAGTSTFTADIETTREFKIIDTLTVVASKLADTINASDDYIAFIDESVIYIKASQSSNVGTFTTAFSSVLSGGGASAVTGAYTTNTGLGVLFDANKQLVINCNNIRQEGNIMNKLLTESLFSAIHGSIIVEGIFNYSSTDIYRTNSDAIFINSDRVRITSVTAAAAGSKETMAYFNPTNAATSADVEEKLYLLTVLDDFLGQSIIRSDFTTIDLNNELNRRKVTEGTLLNAQLNIPAFGSDQ